MDRFERFMILFVLIFFVSISVAVIKTAHGIEQEVKERTERRHLPTECEQYYNDGTDNWKECIGVGYK